MGFVFVLVGCGAIAIVAYIVYAVRHPESMLEADAGKGEMKDNAWAEQFKKTHGLQDVVEPEKPRPIAPVASSMPTSAEPAQVKAPEYDSQKLRRDIQWGIVRGLWMYMLTVLPIALLIGIITAVNASR